MTDSDFHYLIFNYKYLLAINTNSFFATYLACNVVMMIRIVLSSCLQCSQHRVSYSPLLDMYLTHFTTS